MKNLGIFILRNMKKMMKKRSMVICVIGFFLISAFFPSIHSFFSNTNPSVFVISSPSMVPTLNVGDIVLAKNVDPSEIIASEEKGDIVVIKGPQYFWEKGYPKEFLNLPNNTPIIHRAVQKIFDPTTNEWLFVTKGDANQFVDGGWSFLNSSDDKNYYVVEYNSSSVIMVPQSQILGKIYIVIPFIGYCALFPVPIFCVLIALCIFFCFLELRGLELTIKPRKRVESREF
ncbi:MAG: hypothetical protein RBG13Loki_2544 [Promethearchaeota archaeon CR_4]|nr:MAG: hypothetical protein RBG13Loki_2544 [Candidatus Lokiarchaeota archaeon CR_4]